MKTSPYYLIDGAHHNELKFSAKYFPPEIANKELKKILPNRKVIREKKGILRYNSIVFDHVDVLEDFEQLEKEEKETKDDDKTDRDEEEEARLQQLEQEQELVQEIENESDYIHIHNEDDELYDHDTLGGDDDGNNNSFSSKTQ